jgi:hypothetical protein
LEHSPGDDDDWIVSCDDYKSYRSVETFVESLLCSANGAWIIICSSEGHAVAASDHGSFVDALATELDVEPLKEALELVDYWRHEVYEVVRDWSSLRAGAPDWIPSLLRDVLPTELASAAIERHRDWFGLLGTDY